MRIILVLLFPFVLLSQDFATDRVIYWYETDEITGYSDGDSITFWLDKSSNGDTLLPVAADNQPTYRLTGSHYLSDEPYLSFDGTDDFLYQTRQNARMLWFIGRYNSGNPTRWMHIANNNTSTTQRGGILLSSGLLIFYQPGQKWERVYFGSGGTITHYGWQTFKAIFYDDSAQVFMNENQMTQYSTEVLQLSASSTYMQVGAMAEGDNQNPSQYAPIDIACIIAIDTVDLTLADQITEYLQEKYGHYWEPEVEQTISFLEDGSIINTGLTYDPVNDQLICIDYNSSTKDSLLWINMTTGAIASRVELSTSTSQGLAFDNSDSTLWIWGQRGATYKMWNVTTAGVMIDSFNTSAGLAGTMDCVGDSLYLNGYADVNIHVLDKSGNAGAGFTCPVAGDGISFINANADTFWYNDETKLYLLVRNLATTKVVNMYKNNSDYYASDPGGGVAGVHEGLYYHPATKKIWFNADQYTHGAVAGGNRLWEVDPWNVPADATQRADKFPEFPKFKGFK